MSSAHKKESEGSIIDERVNCQTFLHSPPAKVIRVSISTPIDSQLALQEKILNVTPVTSGIDDDRDELSMLSMLGHEIGSCPIIACIKLTKGYSMYRMGSVSYQVRRRCRWKRDGRKQEL
jgi:hypothetical protein